MASKSLQPGSKVANHNAEYESTVKMTTANDSGERPSEKTIPSALKRWIGTGKSYADAPQRVVQAVKTITHLSEDDFEDLEVGMKTITQVAESNIPAQRRKATLPKAESRFSEARPNISLTKLLNRGDWKVPATSTIEDFDDCVGQAVLDGHVSIELGDFENEQLYAPLTVIELWKYLSKAASARKAWKSGIEWFDSSRDDVDPELRARVTKILQDTPWLCTARGVHDSMSITKAAGFLGNTYLNTSHINAMLFQFQQRAGEDVLVGSVNFAEAVTNLPQTYPANAHYEIRKLGGRMLAHPSKYQIVTVLHLPPNHWAALSIDTRGKTIVVSYGDSLGCTPPKDLEDSTRRWVHHYLPDRPYTFVKDWDHGKQLDSISCGIVSINTLKHNVLGTPLWKQDQRLQFRLLEFCDIVEGAFPTVSERQSSPPIPKAVAPVAAAHPAKGESGSPSAPGPSKNHFFAPVQNSSSRMPTKRSATGPSGEGNPDPKRSRFSGPPKMSPQRKLPLRAGQGSTASESGAAEEASMVVDSKGGASDGEEEGPLCVIGLYADESMSDLGDHEEPGEFDWLAASGDDAIFLRSPSSPPGPLPAALVRDGAQRDPVPRVQPVEFLGRATTLAPLGSPFRPSAGGNGERTNGSEADAGSPLPMGSGPLDGAVPSSVSGVDHGELLGLIHSLNSLEVSKNLLRQHHADLLWMRGRLQNHHRNVVRVRHLAEKAMHASSRGLYIQGKGDELMRG